MPEYTSKPEPARVERQPHPPAAHRLAVIRPLAFAWLCAWLLALGFRQPLFASDPCNPPNVMSQPVCDMDSFRGSPPRRIPDGWTEFILSGAPEYSEHFDTYWGPPSLCMRSIGGTFQAGIYTQVAVTPGAGYRASCAWGAPNEPDAFGRQLGIDPTGGTDPLSPNVIWGPMHWGPGRMLNYPPPDVNIDVRARAVADVITVFFLVDHPYSTGDNLIFVDAISLYPDESAPAADTTPPVLATLAVTPTVISTSAGPVTLTLSLEARDDLSGVDELLVAFDSPGDAQHHLVWKWRADDGKTKCQMADDGRRWVCSGDQVLPQHAAHGEWVARIASLVDKAGNRATLGPEDAPLAGVSVVNDSADPTPGPNRAGLVVAYGDGRVETQCVTFADGKEWITGQELLYLSTLELGMAELPAQGEAVCRIGDTGCEPADCLCRCTLNDCTYWSNWRARDGKWVYSTSGVTSTVLTDGSVDGWFWASGVLGQGAAIQPPAIGFDDICASEPGLGYLYLPALASQSPIARTTYYDQALFQACVPNASLTSVQGTVRRSGSPAGGVNVALSYAADGPILATARTGPQRGHEDWAQDFYSLTVHSGGPRQGDWHLWIVNDQGERISAIAQVQTHAAVAEGACQQATVAFDSSAP